MERRFRMKRERAGMLSHRSGFGETLVDFGLCNNEVNQYFDIAEYDECTLVLSTVEDKNSYGVSKFSHAHLQLDDPDEVIWVDDDLADVVGAFQYEVWVLSGDSGHLEYTPWQPPSILERTKHVIIYLSLEVK